MSGYFGAFCPLKPARDFQPGDLIRWLPPAGAYSLKSLQAQHERETGLVVSVSGDVAFVTFGDGSHVACNTAYCHPAATELKKLMKEIKHV